MISTASQEALDRPPHNQRKALRSSLASASETIAVVIAAAKAPIATPPRSRMRGSSAAPPIKPRRYTSARAASAPANAASGSAQGPERCSAIARTAPSPAPPDSPSKNGSASGLRTSACKRAREQEEVVITHRAHGLPFRTLGEGGRDSGIGENGDPIGVACGDRFERDLRRGNRQIGEDIACTRELRDLMEVAAAPNDDGRVVPNHERDGGSHGRRGAGGEAIHHCGERVRGPFATGQTSERPSGRPKVFESIQLEQ